MIHASTALDDNGDRVPIAFIERGSAYGLAGDRERFAQAMAEGLSAFEAYVRVFAPDLSTAAALQDAKARTAQLCRDTRVVLRIQELKAPVVRKVRAKYEYSLQKAFEQCQVAYDLAFEGGDVKGILKAVEMQAKLAKLLSEEINVNHRYGVLDDTKTETLLAMKKELEVRMMKQKRLAQTVVVEGEVVQPTP